MSAPLIVLDEQRCIACKACEIHCQVWNALPADVHPARLRTVLPQDCAGDGTPVTLRTAFVTCFHCDDPPCVRVCPTTAMRQNATSGIVHVVAGLCVGCRACIMACPWRVPQWSSRHEHVVKCDLCRSRLKADLLPACVAGCTTGALSLTSDAHMLAAHKALRDAALQAAATEEETW